jgi:hypothetical protein
MRSGDEVTGVREEKLSLFDSDRSTRKGIENDLFRQHLFVQVLGSGGEKLSDPNRFRR